MADGLRAEHTWKAHLSLSESSRRITIPVSHMNQDLTAHLHPQRSTTSAMRLAPFQPDCQATAFELMRWETDGRSQPQNRRWIAFQSRTRAEEAIWSARNKVTRKRDGKFRVVP